MTLEEMDNVLKQLLGHHRDTLGKTFFDVEKPLAEKGNVESQHNLAVLFLMGYDIPQNFTLAHMWANIAASNGHEESKRIRDGLSVVITKEQIARAQDMAVEWMEKQNRPK